MSFVEIHNLKKSYGEGEARQTVLSGVDITIEKGEFCVLLGPSGSGKSTLLNIIGGIDNADDGYVMIDGEKTADMNESRLTQYRRNHLGYVFQLYNLIPNLTVRENVEVGAYLSKKPLPVDDLLKTLGLYEHRHKLPTQLSGGQQQRTAIGRAVIKNPDILLCDGCPGLQHLEGDPRAFGAHQQRVRQHHYYGDPQRCAESDGGPGCEAS